MKTPVVFRREDQDIIALFPTLPHDKDGILCVCYTFAEGHSSADYKATIARTKPVTPEQYNELFVYLGRMYDMKVYQKHSDSPQVRRENLTTQARRKNLVATN